MESTPLTELAEFAQQTVQLAARALSLKPTAFDDGVDFGVAGIIGRCVVFSVDERRDGVRVGLGAELSVPYLGRTELLRNRTTGVGRSPEEAVLQGVQVLIESGLPAVLAGLSEPPPQARWIGRTTAPDGQTPVAWEAHEGPLQVLGRERSRLLAELSERPPFAHYGSLAAFGQRPLSWLQTSVYRGEDGAVSPDCILNGQPLGEAAACLSALTFPEVQGYLFFRQFHLIKARLL